LRRQKGPVVTNLSTTQAIDEVAALEGCPVRRTRIGEINVVEDMIQSAAVIGGEGNGGVILPQVHHCRDSMGGLGAVLQLMAEEEKSLRGILDELPSYVMIKTKVSFPQERLAALQDALRSEFAGADVNTLDGLKLSWPGEWLHVRPSNTEPVVRIVAEASTRRRAHLLLNRCQALLSLF
jgi:phosphomannomutase